MGITVGKKSLIFGEPPALPVRIPAGATGWKLRVRSGEFAQIIIRFGSERTEQWAVGVDGREIIPLVLMATNRRGSQAAIRCDNSEFMAILSEISANVANLTPELRQRALALLDALPEVVRFESGPASAGAVVTLLLKPSDRLLDLLSASRTGNFDNLVIKDAHSGL